MKRAWIAGMTAAVAAVLPRGASAQNPDVTLHVNPRWKECAIQLDASLTQPAWRRFTREVAVVAYFRPLTDARPMGAGNFEASIFQWQTAIDETSSAWNDTFVHPDSTHWLTGDGSLSIPGLMVRRGISDRIDAGAYITKNFNSNYGLWGAQVQYNAFRDTRDRFAASARVTVASVYGPENVDVMVYGLDLVASGTYPVGRRFAISPYAGVTTMLSTTRENSAVVNLNDERTVGAMGTIGAVAHYGIASVAVEYNVASVNAFAFKVGVNNGR